MFIYFILSIGTILIAAFSIHTHLKRIQHTQQFHSQWLQEIFAKNAKPGQYRRLFQAGGDTQSELNPLMLAPYLAVMTNKQNHRYRLLINS